MISSGFLDIDEVIGGIEIPEFIIVGGSTSSGKTSFLTSLIKKLSIEKKIPSTYFNFQTTNKLLFNRFLSNITEIPLKQFLNLRLNDSEKHNIFHKTPELETAPIRFEEKLNQSTLESLRKQIVYSIQQNQSNIFVIDNIHFLHTIIYGEKNKSINNTIRELKSISKEFNITIIGALDIDDNKIFARSDRRPKLLDFLNYTEVEETADLIFLIYRPELYKIYTWENDSPCYNQAEVIIAKNRMGPTGTSILSYYSDFKKFENFNSAEQFEQSPQSFRDIKIMSQNINISNYEDDDDFPF
ncbi:DnaB-like helicase C-terminal domain-containing protein [Chryseobacterium herbae]|uniref:DnaB-like helicase C-terminal domain-containing protein n=1 Tax=Chryseobacterium herbae TaxID=2976476 RepID=A0ABT2IWH3_9FLAO|nr:DnaB-like helicase C-terminal domain-containing protein [Chryseobacterium sp. pc1-10]MCT2563189.1 DnaB-like helicase C-terminal domain-containing protein [Chryseobacterium sp. pc1-10]